jgi:azurin
MVALALAMSAPLALAAPVPSQTTCATTAAADSTVVAAERGLIKAKLMDFGLTEKKAGDRVALLTDEEVHAIAADLNSLQTAGMRSDETTTVLLVIVVLVLLVH